MSAMRRMAFLVVAIGALAALILTVDRWRYERHSRSVEIAMDQQDLADFATAFGYDMTELLRQMRGAGLSSLAIYEETGQRINLGSHAFAQTGQQIVDAARISPLSDVQLADLVRKHAIESGSMYILVYDAPTLARYVSTLRNQLEPRNVRVLRATLPALLMVRTQIDFFNNLGLGVPQDVADQARSLHLLVDPRVQNNERLDADHIAALFRQMLQGDNAGTVIFFGLRNEVLGFPYNLDGTAAAFRDFREKHGPYFGAVEFYDPTLAQKGSDTLGRKIPDLTVRVQAIARTELDKIDLDTVIARYVLGVRERNIRVIYIRPFPHVVQVKQPDGAWVTLSPEATNLEMLRRLRDALKANGFAVGHATPFTDFGGPVLQVLYFITALGVAASFLLLLDLFGWSRAWMPATFYGITTVAFWGALALGHHDDVVRRLWALGAALTFSVLAGMTLAPEFRADLQNPPAGTLRGDARAGLRRLLIAAGVALAGAVFVIGLLAQATFMLEVQQFFGVKALLIAPPIALLLLYAFTPFFGSQVSAAVAGHAPVRAWQLLAVFVVAGAAVILLTRSGNQPDVGISAFETHVRGWLTLVLGARPRFKEFLVGFPAIVVLPALLPAHRRAVGWLIIAAAGLGLADVLDTFSHIHTSLIIGLLRLFNALVLGGAIGVALQAAYRRLFRSNKERAATPSAP